MSENNEKRMPNFLLLDAQTLINRDQVCMVDQVSEGHCRLLFSENFTPTITGDGANELVALLMANSITVDGTSVMNIWKKLGEQP
jgi:hypothetical protein